MQIPFNKPSKVGNEIEYIINAISTGHLSGNGKYTKLSENFFSDFFKAPALLTSSCTHSLEMVARLLQLEPGDEVIIPSFTFVSTANAFALRGAIFFLAGTAMSFEISTDLGTNLPAI